MGAVPPHPRDGRKLLGHLRGPHTHLHKAHSAFPTRYSTVGLNCAAPFGCRTAWCARHPQQLGLQWGIGSNALTPQGWKDTAWSPSGAHKHLKDHIWRCQHRVSDGLNCGLGVILWCGHHLQQLGSPWGMGAMPPHPRDGRTLLAHLGGAHTHLHNHIRRCRHRIRRYRITVWVRFGCCTVVCTSSSACRVTMGHWGQCHHIPGMAGHCLATLGGGPHTHRIRPLVRIAQRRSGVVRWCVRYPQQLGPHMGHCPT